MLLAQMETPQKHRPSQHTVSATSCIDLRLRKGLLWQAGSNFWLPKCKHALVCECLAFDAGRRWQCRPSC